MTDATPSSLRPLIILVHGTEAGSPAVPPAPLRWWEKGSAFRLSLEAACPGHDAEAFLWGQGGANSEILRRAGGRALLRRLEELEQEGRPYHLVGHSHGGSVVWQALAQSEHWWRHADRGNPRARKLQHLKSWTTVGTPFQDFAPANAETIGAIVLLLVALAAVSILCALVWPLHDALELGGVLRHAHDWSAPPWSPIDEPAPPSPLASTGYRLAWIASTVISAGALAAVGVLLFGLLLDRVLRRVHLAGSRRWRTVLAAVAFAVPWSILTWNVVDRVGGRLGLALVAAGLLATVAGTMLLTVAAIRVLANWWPTLVFRRRESLAARHYGALWREIHHPQDEAIAALRCALLEAPRIVPRPPASQLDPLGAAVAFVVEPLKRIADQFAWRTAMSRIQGNDLLGADVQACGVAPRALVKQLGRAHQHLGSALAQSADREGRQLVGEIRDWLAQAYLSRHMDDAVQKLAAKLTFGAAVHTSYFTKLDRKGSVRGPQREVLALVAGHVLDTPAKPTPAPRAPIVEAYGLHRRIAALRMTGAVAAIMLMTALYGLGHTLVVTPLQRSTQIETIKGLPKRSGALATSDSPVVAAFLVRLAAAAEQGDLLEALKRLTEPNVRAVAGQRLAFAYGLAGAQQGLEPIAGEVTRWPENWENPGYSERTAHLLFLSRLAGAVSGGHAVTRNEAERALAAWRVLPCEETDRDAAAALTALALAGAGDVNGIAALAHETAAKREGRCGGREEPAEQQAAWIRAFLVSRAEDVVSWESQGGAAGPESARRKAAARTLLRAIESPDGAPLLKKLAADAAENDRDCAEELERFANRLEGGGEAGCAVERRIAAAKVRADLLGKPAAVSSGRLDQILGRARQACRGDSPLATRRLDLSAAEAAGVCARAVDANRRVVAAAAVLFAAGAPGLSESEAAPRDETVWENLAGALEPTWKNMPATLDAMGDGALWPVLDVATRGGPADPAARKPFDRLVSAIIGSQAALAGCRADGPDPCRGGPFVLDHIWTAVDMLLVENRREDARSLVSNAKAQHPLGSCPPPEIPENLTEPSSLLRLAVAAAKANDRESASTILDHLACPGREAQACPAYLGILSTDETVTYAELAQGRPELIDLARNCLKRKIARENSGVERARQIQQLARIYMFDDDLYASRDAAERAGAVNFVIAGLCPVLDRERERSPLGPGGGGPALAAGLRPISRWPQPAPVYFGTGPRFTYAHERPGPLACQGRPPEDHT